MTKAKGAIMTYDWDGFAVGYMRAFEKAETTAPAEPIVRELLQMAYQAFTADVLEPAAREMLRATFAAFADEGCWDMDPSGEVIWDLDPDGPAEDESMWMDELPVRLSITPALFRDAAKQCADSIRRMADDGEEVEGMREQALAAMAEWRAAIADAEKIIAQAAKPE